MTLSVARSLTNLWESALLHYQVPHLSLPFSIPIPMKCHLLQQSLFFKPSCGDLHWSIYIVIKVQPFDIYNWEAPLRAEKQGKDTLRCTLQQKPFCILCPRTPSIHANICSYNCFHSQPQHIVRRLLSRSRSTAAAAACDKHDTLALLGPLPVNHQQGEKAYVAAQDISNSKDSWRTQRRFFFKHKYTCLLHLEDFLQIECRRGSSECFTATWKV